jgi:hypothetical protein
MSIRAYLTKIIFRQSFSSHFSALKQMYFVFLPLNYGTYAPKHDIITQTSTAKNESNTDNHQQTDKRNILHYKQAQARHLAAFIPHLAAPATQSRPDVGREPRVRIVRHNIRGQLLPSLRSVGRHWTVLVYQHHTVVS